MRITIKQKILSYLIEHPGWQYGGIIEDFIRHTDGHKASNASRRCRELCDENKIERRLERGVVQYRIRQSDNVTSFLRDYPSKVKEVVPSVPVNALF